MTRTTPAPAIPAGELDARFSSPEAAATPWSAALAVLETAETFWLSTVRPDGRPHVATLLAVWLDGSLYVCTGETEQKARNLAVNPHVALTTGCNTAAGLDIVVEGDAVRLSDDAILRRVAGAYVTKYGEDWRFAVHEGAFYHGEGSVREEAATRAFVYAIAPVTVFGFTKGDVFAQTRWRF